jgi:hypothetical protein
MVYKFAYNGVQLCRCQCKTDVLITPISAHYSKYFKPSRLPFLDLGQQAIKGGTVVIAAVRVSVPARIGSPTR